MQSNATQNTAELFTSLRHVQVSEFLMQHTHARARAHIHFQLFMLGQIPKETVGDNYSRFSQIWCSLPHQVNGITSLEKNSSTKSNWRKSLTCCHCLHSMRSKVYKTVLCLSVCLSQHGPTAANPLLQVCSCGSGWQKISTAAAVVCGRRMQGVPDCQHMYAEHRLVLTCSDPSNYS